MAGWNQNLAFAEDDELSAVLYHCSVVIVFVVVFAYTPFTTWTFTAPWTGRGSGVAYLSTSGPNPVHAFDFHRALGSTLLWRVDVTRIFAYMYTYSKSFQKHAWRDLNRPMSSSCMYVGYQIFFNSNSIVLLLAIEAFTATRRWPYILFIFIYSSHVLTPQPSGQPAGLKGSSSRLPQGHPSNC